jgi:hypothetical protein
MSVAILIALGAVAISLFTVFIALRSAKTKTQAGGDGGAGYIATDSGGSDCSVSDGVGCDGGGGGD